MNAKYDVRIAEEILFSEPFMGGEHIKTVRRWTITITGTSYLCTITECPCGLRRQTGLKYKPRPADEPREDWSRPSEIEQVFSVPLTNCTCKSEAHRKSGRAARGQEVCHGWHRARIDKVFGEVARAKSSRRELPPRAGLAMPLSAYAVEHLAELTEKYKGQAVPAA